MGVCRCSGYGFRHFGQQQGVYQIVIAFSPSSLGQGADIPYIQILHAQSGTLVRIFGG